MLHRKTFFNWAILAAYLACGALIVVFTLPIFGWRALDVLTPSMRPAVSPGSLVLVHRVPLSALSPGQIVTYSDPHHRGVTITHRIVRTGTSHGVPTLITKGDANATPDPPVPAGRVVGRVATVVPGAGRLLGLLHAPAALLLLVVVPGLYVIYNEAKHLRRILRAPRHRTRRLDGLYRSAALVLAAGLVALATGVTLAQTTSTATLVGNSVTAASTATSSPTVSPTASPTTTPSPSPTASPCTSVSITNTGPGSTNTVHCSSTITNSRGGSSSISVSNSVNQSATTGSININHNSSSSSVTPGNITNTSNSTFDLNIMNP